MTTIELTPPVRAALNRFAGWLQTQLDAATTDRARHGFQEQLNVVQLAKEGRLDAVQTACDYRADLLQRGVYVDR